MKTITKTVIPLSKIPVELRNNPAIQCKIKHVYNECHIDKKDPDDLTKWLLETYPNLSRKISFLIHIDV
jgi:hypothetical protein